MLAGVEAMVVGEPTTLVLVMAVGGGVVLVHGLGLVEMVLLLGIAVVVVVEVVMVVVGVVVALMMMMMMLERVGVRMLQRILALERVVVLARRAAPPRKRRKEAFRPGTTLFQPTRSQPRTDVGASGTCGE